MSKLVYLWFAVKTVFCNCQSDQKINDFKKVRSEYKISKIGKLSSVVNESSGLAKGLRNNSFWTINDSGGAPELYEIDSTGRLRSTRPVADATHVDWEDLTQDSLGHIYIGDFGNNANTRRSLNIYKISENNLGTEKITFSYSDQKDFPPSPENLNYDCEAFFYHHENLYLFSKNRSKTNHFVKMYKIPSVAGNYVASPQDSIQIKTQVTSAAISPDGKTFALLTYGKILLFDVGSEGVNFDRPKGCFRFVHKQAEALIFLNNTDMLATNEQGQLYKITYR
ncbi:hypothetical protein [Dyadobacter sp. 32]|uniref:hypothetical protein n=1 Tax=Dyadobacter sp. 32 TaxID=538966 RepID=UPI0011EBAD08